MPYLDSNFQQEIETATDCENDTAYFASLKGENFAGAINYWNFKVCRKRFSTKQFKRYWQFACWVGTMILCILEVWRRIICDYEDEKIRENGDVF